MAATKLQFKYGSWTDVVAKQMSLATPGLVVFNYGTKTIYVNGDGFGMNDEEIAALLKRVTTLEEFRKALYVAGYAQAEYATDASSLTIFGIKQGEENSDTNTGKIAHDDTNDIVINFAAAYDKDTNKVALQSNLTDLKKEILGTLDPKELEKTLDTIREIQEQLVNGAWRIKDPDGNVIKTTRYPVKTEPVTIGGVTYPVGSVVWTDGTDPIEDATVYAWQMTSTSDVEYTKVGDKSYSELKNLGNIDQLVADIDGIKEDIQNNLVEVDENEAKSFVTAVSDGTKGDSHYTIGVNYGTFKTGHGNVMDETSTAFVDGIATVEAVQKYIEERLTWVSFETDAQTVATSLNNISGEEISTTVDTSSELNNSLLIKNN